MQFSKPAKSGTLGTSNDVRITRNGSYFNNNIFGQVTGETSNGGTKYVREPNGTPVALQNGGASYYYTSDYNGATDGSFSGRLAPLSVT